MIRSMEIGNIVGHKVIPAAVSILDQWRLK